MSFPQRCFTRYYLEHPHEVALDDRGKIFLNLHNLPVQLVLNGSGQLVDNVTHYGSPCMVHANGPKKGSIAALAQELEGLQR